MTTDERRFAASSLLRLLRHHLTEMTFCAEPRARPVVVAIPNRILDRLGPALEAVAQLPKGPFTHLHGINGSG